MCKWSVTPWDEYATGYNELYGICHTESNVPVRFSNTEIKYVSCVSFAADNAECSICLAAYGLDEIIAEIPCKHAFHTQCLVTWMKEVGVFSATYFNLSQG